MTPFRSKNNNNSVELEATLAPAEAEVGAVAKADQYISETKSARVIVSKDSKWHKNTAYICGKARSKLWILRRLLKVDLDIHQMFDVYSKEIRSILEMAVPVWHPGLKKKQSADIESVQKMAMKIILQDKYVDYKLACSTLSAKTLEERRLQLC